jgi:hypothetical protein
MDSMYTVHTSGQEDGRLLSICKIKMKGAMAGRLASKQ